MKYAILALTIAFFVISPNLSANPRMVARIDAPSPSILQSFLIEGADIAAYKPGVYLDLVLTQEQYALLQRDFPSIRVTQTETQMKENLRPAKDIPGYRSYAQMLSELMQLQAQYPDLINVSSFGSGWGAIYADQGIPLYNDYNHDLWAVKVSANVMANEDEPAFFFVGEHHAREPLSTETCMGILIHLAENYGSDPTVTGILDSSEIWIVPLLNPDGHKIVLEETDVWWRKNLRDNNSNQAFDQDEYGYGFDGADLNRNYSWYWGYTSATDDQMSAVYHGPGPFSEPETQALRDLLLSRPFLAGIGYHTYGEYVLYPYGYVNGIAAPDQTELSALGNEIAALLPSQEYGNYAPGPSWGLYPVSGGLDDWIYGETGAFAYTIEMATQFIPPADQIPQIVQYQVNGALALLQRKNRSILCGHVRDANTGAPLNAMVLVDGIDDQPVFRQPKKSEATFGAYHYFLPEGNHTVHYICPGYATQTLSVQISAEAQTIQDVSLQPTQAQVLSILVQDDFFEPLPGATVSFEDLPQMSLVSGADGYITIEEFHPGVYRLRVTKPGHETLRIRRNIDCGFITLRLTSQPIFSDGLENNLSNWLPSGTWNRTATESFTGSYSLTDSPGGNYQNNTDSACSLAAPIPLHNIHNANLQFQLKRSLALDGDNLIVEASTNGWSWVVLGFYEGSSDWTLESYDLNSFIGNDLHLRFRLFTGSYETSNGVFIDDIKLFLNGDVSSNNDPLPPPAIFSLCASPNPFTGKATITLKAGSNLPDASIDIYNVKGQLVKNLGRMDLSKGEHQLVWNGLDYKGIPAASGVYLVKVSGPAGAIVSVRIARIK